MNEENELIWKKNEGIKEMNSWMNCKNDWINEWMNKRKTWLKMNDLTWTTWSEWIDMNDLTWLNWMERKDLNEWLIGLN